MAQYTNQDFIRGDRRTQNRALVLSGIVAAIVLVLVIGTIAVVYPKASAPDGVELHVVVPAVGPGVKPGSKLLLHGAEVGQVTGVSAETGTEVRLDVVIDDAAATELTDDFSIDYRPQNYFGTTAVNLIDNPSGNALRAGQTVERATAPDYTMSTMIENGSLVVDGTLTRDMVRSLNKVMRYGNGLAPLIESMFTVADTVAKTQQQLPSELLEKMNGVLAVFPQFNYEALRSVSRITESEYNRRPDGTPGVAIHTFDTTDDALKLISGGVFGAVANVLGSHSEELLPLTSAFTAILQPVPGMIGGGAALSKTRNVIDRLRSSFSGSDSQKTLQLRIVLDQLPGQASSLRMGGELKSAGRGN